MSTTPFKTTCTPKIQQHERTSTHTHTQSELEQLRFRAWIVNNIPLVSFFTAKLIEQKRYSSSSEKRANTTKIHQSMSKNASSHPKLHELHQTTVAIFTRKGKNPLQMHRQTSHLGHCYRHILRQETFAIQPPTKQDAENKANTQQTTLRKASRNAQPAASLQVLLNTVDFYTNREVYQYRRLFKPTTTRINTEPEFRATTKDTD